MGTHNIIVANEYASVHTKNWAIPPKPEPLHVERKLKGPTKLKMGNDKRKTRKPVMQTFGSPEEALQAMWEDTESQIAAYRYPDQDSFKNAEKQTGKGMWSNDLVRKVLKLNSKLFVEDSVALPGNAAFYTTIEGDKKYTNANFKKGFIPEFTIMKCDAADLPVEFIWGWRTVLMRLVKFGALTMRQINKVWGDVHYSDARGKHWAAHMAGFR